MAEARPIIDRRAAAWLNRLFRLYFAKKPRNGGAPFKPLPPPSMTPQSAAPPRAAPPGRSPAILIDRRDEGS